MTRTYYTIPALHPRREYRTLKGARSAVGRSLRVAKRLLTLYPNEYNRTRVAEFPLTIVEHERTDRTSARLSWPPAKECS